MTPYEAGYRAGHADRLMGYCSDYAWFIEPWPGYPQSYSVGYRDGWMAR